MTTTPPAAARPRPFPRGPSLLLALWLAAAVAFIALAGFAAVASRFPGDLWVSRRIQEIDSAAFTSAIDWAEDLGDAPETTRLFGWEIECSQIVDDFPGCLFISLVTPNVVVVFLGAFGGLWLFNRRLEAFLLLSTGVALVANAGLERIVRRPSPDTDLISVVQEPGPFTFPSGHAAGVVVLYGLLFYFAAVLVRQPVLRLIIQAACLYVSVFTIIERLYVGVHWLSDMYGGVLHGALWLALIILVYRQRSRAGVPAPSSPRLSERIRHIRID